jgi:ABC-type transport system substrate-binding protein
MNQLDHFARIQKSRHPRFLVRAVVATTLSLTAQISLAETLIVSGWAPAAQIDLKSPPPIWLGDDAIIGRLACPSVVRLEVDRGKNAPALLKSAPHVDKNGERETWTFTIRPGLRWWSGVTVDADGLAGWLKSNLSNIVQERLGESVPSNVEITASGSSTVKISWPKSPGYGPYVLSGASLHRMTGGALECAGLYAASAIPGGIELSVSKGYTAKYPKIQVLAGSEPVPSGRKAILFSMAGKKAQVQKTSIKTSACDSRLDVPLMTALIWNPASPLAAKSELRDSLTRATPRGEILRTAAGDIGSLVSAPILRTHPGYNGKLLVKAYNLDSAAQGFEKAGFRQQHIGLPRSQGQDKPVFLRIARLSGRQDLVEKMIGDSYASLGVNSQFDDSGTPGITFDAAIVSVFIPWTSQDLRPLAHSDALNAKGKSQLPFVPVTDKDLDGLLDSYSRGLTKADPPDFELLRKVHQKWYDLEPWTVLMAHQYCVEARGLKLPKKLNSLDSDWFRSVVMD